MMKIQLKLILTACIVYFGLTSVQPHNQVADNAAPSKVNDHNKIQENFQTLFDSIAKNDFEKSEHYQEILKREVANKQQAFDNMREELQIARNRNAYKKSYFYKGETVDENFIAATEGTNENNRYTDPVALNLKRRALPRVTPSHWAPWRDLSEEEHGMLLVDKYRYALKKTLDCIWVSKCHIHDATYYHELLTKKDGQEIENVAQPLKDVQFYLSHLADGVSKLLIRRDLTAWERCDPINTTIYGKLMNEFTDVKERVQRYKPKEGTSEYTKILRSLNNALYDLPVRYKPIRKMILKIQNETWVNDERRKILADRGETVFGIAF